MPGRGLRHHIAVDLGASSGRVMDVGFDGTRLTLDELHRFPNRPVRVPGAPAGGARWCWDVLSLWAEILDGLSRAGATLGGAVASVGIDTWAVDYGLLGRSGRLLGFPACYRDDRTAEPFARLRKSNHRGSRTLPFRILQHQRLSTFHDRHAGVGSS